MNSKKTFLVFIILKLTNTICTSELYKTKKELVGWIHSLEEDSILELLSSLKLSSEGKSKDWWQEITESERVNILSGIRDYQQGETMKSSEFWNELSNG